ncbi:MAG: tRNA (adenosine(37)-N6)-dimethylallyltransferase MiaA [Magnetococcales bacterium]|nr:tRNA (adenosine(37)-N6)-dimethylallyltransferase MiaA [Magnetococcales bacterium]
MGPTATGKTGLALELARRFPLEIVNADSIQVYRGMDIGSAKPTLAEQADVPHHLLDVTTPDDPFSAERYRRAALAAAATCRARGQVPLVVGGSGLYLRALASGLAPIPRVPEALRRAIHRVGVEEGWPVLYERLRGLDPEVARNITPNDPQRIVRALAVRAATGRCLSDWWREPHGGLVGPVLKLVLEGPREVLYERIERRMANMMAQGFLDEAAALLARGYARTLPAMKAVGYRQLFRHLDGELTLAEAVELAVRETRRYAKRQLTWLRAERNLVTLPAFPAVAGLAMATDRVAAFLEEAQGR